MARECLTLAPECYLVALLRLILDRAAALIVRRPRAAPLLFNPLKVLIAVFRAFVEP